MSRKFENESFWNERYSTNTQLGSGPGSRGQIALAKKRIVNKIIEDQKITSVLDYGCGDLHCVDVDKIGKYVGVDISTVVLESNRKKHPNKEFVLPKDLNPNIKHDLVICQDVLIHQDTKSKFDEIFNLCYNLSEKCFLFSVLKNKSYAVNNVFHWDLNPELKIDKIFEYRDTQLLIIKK